MEGTDFMFSSIKSRSESCSKYPNLLSIPLSKTQAVISFSCLPGSVNRISCWLSLTLLTKRDALSLYSFGLKEEEQVPWQLNNSPSTQGAFLKPHNLGQRSKFLIPSFKKAVASSEEKKDSKGFKCLVTFAI